MLSLYTLLALPLVAAVLGSAVVSLVLCFHDLFRRRHSLPSLHFRESALNSRLLARCGLRQRVFSPSFWLSSPHVQTVLAACWPRGGDAQEMTFQREYLQMRDKGVVALDWVLSVQPRLKRKSTVLLVLPPVTGDAHTCSALCELATRRGFRTVVFNRRGHGGSVLTTAKLLSAADPSDLRQVIKYLRMRFPKSRLAAVAHGTGCGLLISYLGEFGSSAFLSAGACVSPCYDTVEKFSGSLRSVYDLVHLLKLKWILLQHAKALSSLVDVKKALLKAWSFRAYEEAVYCRMYNYTSRSDSTSRSGGNHSSTAAAVAVAVNANGVAATASSSASAVSSSSSPVAGGCNSNGGLVCGSVSGSGGLSHAAGGAPNGNIVPGEGSETVTKKPGGSASQPASSSSTLGSSQSASKSSQPSSLSSGSSSLGGPLASHSASSLSTPSSSSSALSQQQQVSQSVTEVSSQPSLSASQTVSAVQKMTSSLDSTSTSESTSTSGCSSKCAAASKLPPGCASRSTFSSPASSLKESSASQPKSTTETRSSTPASSASQLTASVPVTRSKSASSASPPPSLAASRAASSSVSSPSQLPLTQPTSFSPSSPSPAPPPSPSSTTNNNNNNGNTLAALEEYWERNNPIRDVDDIAVPVLCINSLDDPFFVSSTSAGSSSSTIPYDLFRCYPNFLLVVTEKGGHCGFLERYPFKSWADSLCLDYLEAVFELTTRGYVSATAATTTSTSGSASSASSSNSRRNTRSTI